MMFEIYKNTSHSNPPEEYWCWRLKLKNDHVLAYSADHFDTFEECEQNIQIIMTIDNSVPIIYIKDKQPTLMSVFMDHLRAINPSKKDKNE